MSVPSDDHVPETTFTLPCHPIDVFSTPEEALSSINSFARQHGYAVVIQHTYYDKDKQRRRLKLPCDRHGVKRQKSPRPNTKRLLNTSSRRCGCPMVVNVVRVLGTSQWKIDYRGLETTHNHPPTSTPSSHPDHRRADRDSFVIGAIKTDGESGVRADQTLARLLVERPTLSLTAGDIYNERQRSLLVELNGRSRIDHLLHLLNSAEYTSDFQQDDHGHITHLFFAFNENVEIFSKNCDVIIMDCTYKTNGFGMPLLNIIGVSGSNTTLHLAQAFLRGETEMDYHWALPQLKVLLSSSNIPDPRVFIVDCDLALLNALQRVFPHIPVLLCVWHIMKDVEKHARLHSFPQEIDPENATLEPQSGVTQLCIELSVSRLCIYCSLQQLKYMSRDTMTCNNCHRLRLPTLMMFGGKSASCAAGPTITLIMGCKLPRELKVSIQPLKHGLQGATLNNSAYELFDWTRNWTYMANHIDLTKPLNKNTTVGSLLKYKL